MTREDAVAKWLEFGSARLEIQFRATLPEKWCNKMLLENAEDAIDGLVALGVIRLDPSAGQT